MQLFCRSCNIETAHFTKAKPFPHVGHLLLTMVTGGLWIFGWVIMYSNHKQSQIVCSRCDTAREAS